MSQTPATHHISDWSAFHLDPDQKKRLFLSEIQGLCDYHDANCQAYHDLVTKLPWQATPYHTLNDVPFLPVRLFKNHRLMSVDESQIVKTMTSSGTTSQIRSQIFLDRETSALQVKILSKIMADFIGPLRLPMLVIDCKATVKERLRFSARTAGILGFSMFGRKVEYALDDDMSLNIERIKSFIATFPDQPILLFGFTFIVWQHVVLELEKQNIHLPLDKAILIHGGGWKQMLAQSVTGDEFKSRLKDCCALDKVHNYYGMVEQTGSIFMECEAGHLHASSWSEIIIRNPLDFSISPIGEQGLVQLLSLIPRSYPGHSLLSEDLGRIIGHDTCSCGRKGTFFAIDGRLKKAEMRGCSDTYS
mgnify:CR=1 FL=1